MTIYDYEDLASGLELGVVPGWFSAETAGRLRPALTGAQLVRLAADFAYDQLSSANCHPECAEAMTRLLSRFDRLGDTCT
jgi:hypothetical protein